MAKANVTTSGAYVRKISISSIRRWKLWLSLSIALIIVLASLTTWRILSMSPAPTEAPEAARVLQAQTTLSHFGILIPAFLPTIFDRENVEILVASNGQTGEPMVEMAYRANEDATVFLQQWVPINPDMETLSGSRLIQTKWGKSYLLTQGENFAVLWVDVGQLRISITSNNLGAMSREQLILAAETLGLASNMQVYSFSTELPQIKDITPPPPFEVMMNDEGVQELNLTITPGGYSPIRFAVKTGIPVKINFRALGEVGCGNTLLFPLESVNMKALTVSKTKPLEVLEFTPNQTGDFNFYCTSNCYRGIMTVR